MPTLQTENEVTEGTVVAVTEVELTLEDKVDYLIRQVDSIARKIAEFEASVGPALSAVSNGGIFSMLTGRSKK